MSYSFIDVSVYLLVISFSIYILARAYKVFTEAIIAREAKPYLEND